MADSYRRWSDAQTSVILQMTEEKFIEDKLRNALQYDPSMSLFDKHKSQTIEQCAPHAHTHMIKCAQQHSNRDAGHNGRRLGVHARRLWPCQPLRRAGLPAALGRSSDQ